MAPNTRPRFVVGIDFGTTFTSVSIVHSAQPTVEHLVRGWPGGSRSGPRADVVPTEILYGETRRFGYEIEEAPSGELDSLRWFKLLLHTQQDAVTSEHPAPQSDLLVPRPSLLKRFGGAPKTAPVENAYPKDSTLLAPPPPPPPDPAEVASVSGSSISETTSAMKKMGLFGRLSKAGKKMTKSMAPPSYNSSKLPATAMLWNDSYHYSKKKKGSISEKTPTITTTALPPTPDSLAELPSPDPVPPRHELEAPPFPNPGKLPPTPPNPKPRELTSYDPSASRIVSRTVTTIHSLNLTPLTITTHFLTHVYNTIQDEASSTWPSLTVNKNHFEYILTVPAIWSDVAKNNMIRAAEGAGFGRHGENFELIGEPEAAAVYTLKQNETSLNVGETVIICDAGGGTVDLIAYRIKSLKPLKVDEIVAGSGDLCGSVFLDEAFTNYITAVMGADWFRGLKARSKKTMMKSWQEEKFKFGSEEYPDDHEIGIAVPGAADDEDRNIDGGFHYMPVQEVTRIFDPIVGRIVKLVGEQVKGVQKGGDKVKAVVLVGGFGASQYLKKQLQSTYASSGIQILTPGSNAQTAVARGAVLRGLDGSIVLKRRARRYYGSAAHTVFRSSMGPDAAARRVYSSADDRFEVPEKMFWYVKKGDILSAGGGDDDDNEGISAVTFPFFRHFLVNAPNPATAYSRFKVKDTLYAWEPSEPGSAAGAAAAAAAANGVVNVKADGEDARAEGKRGGGGEGDEDEEVGEEEEEEEEEQPPEFRWRDPLRVVPVGVLETDLSMIPKSKLKTCYGKSGHQYYKIAYALRMTLEGEVLKFQLQFDGQIYSTCTVKFNNDPKAAAAAAALKDVLAQDGGEGGDGDAKKKKKKNKNKK